MLNPELIDVNLQRARSTVATRQRAEQMYTTVDPNDIEVLATSPWPAHKIDAGWLCIAAFMQTRRKLAHRSGLVERASVLWTGVAEDPRATPLEQLQGSYAATHAPLWYRAKFERYSLDKRAAERQTRSIQALHLTGRLALSSSTSRRQTRAINGVLSEIICSDLLNRLSLAHGEDSLTLPAERWNDLRNDEKKSFDLWQLMQGKWSKVQVKSTEGEHHGYEDDIAIVYLNQHWPDANVGEIAKYLTKAELRDPQALAVARSMQTEIELQLA